MQPIGEQLGIRGGGSLRLRDCRPGRFGRAHHGAFPVAEGFLHAPFPSFPCRATVRQTSNDHGVEWGVCGRFFEASPKLGRKLCSRALERPQRRPCNALGCLRGPFPHSRGGNDAFITATRCSARSRSPGCWKEKKLHELTKVKSDIVLPVFSPCAINVGEATAVLQFGKASRYTDFGSFL